MSHEIAKAILERADTFVSRTEAVKTALGLGMPLQAVEEYLDWLDMIRSDCCPDKQSGGKVPSPKDTGTSPGD